MRAPGGFNSFSRNSLTHSAGGANGNTMQSDLTAFGNCPFNASNLSMSVYGNNSIIGGGRGALALMNNLNQYSPQKAPGGLAGDMSRMSSSPYYGKGRPSAENQNIFN